MGIFDVIVIGAGHNGLICACYLARLGLKVGVLERRGIVDGAVCTEEIVPGFRFDVGSSVHIMFRSTPIMEELELAAYDLEYRVQLPGAACSDPRVAGSGVRLTSRGRYWAATAN